MSDKTGTENLHKRLTALTTVFLGQDVESIFKRLSQLSLARSPKDEFPLSRYWPNSPRASAGFASVPAIYTAAGYKHLSSRLDDLAAEA